MRTSFDAGNRTRRQWSSWTWATLAAFLLGFLLACTASAKTRPEVSVAPLYDSVDSRWLPWIGCWQLIQEIGDADAWSAATPDRDPSAREPDGRGGTSAARFRDLVFVCLMPTDMNAGVDMTTVADGAIFFEKSIYADGLQHPVEEASCDGWQLHQWSQDGLRLYTRAELACQPSAFRLVSGVSLLEDASTWLDIQLVDTGNERRLAVRRYQRASVQVTSGAGMPTLPEDVRSRAASAAELAASARLSVTDVIEATRILEPDVVEAVLVETDASFDLDSGALVELDDAGVDPTIVDVMVALSYPEEFALNRQAAQRWSSRGPSGGYGYGGYSYQRYYDLYPYYVSPFGYSYLWSPYDVSYFPGPRTYILGGGGGRGLSRGRAYRRQGYTQVRSRDRSSGGQRGVRARGSGTQVVSGGSTRSGGGSRGGTSAGRGGGGRSGGTSAGRSGGGGRAGGSSGGRVTPGGYRRGGTARRPPR